MKKLLYILFFSFLIFFGTIIFTFATGIFQIQNITYDRLSFDIYSSISSVKGDPVFSLAEINQQVDKIPHSLKPLFKMLVRQTPRPKKGMNVKLLSKSYTIHFNNDEDWEYFKRTLIKVIDLKNDKGHKTSDISKAKLVR